MSEDKKNKWKDYLLRSSLPLEQVVAEKLENCSFYISGEYTYTRPNENKVETEFSTDLHAFDMMYYHEDEHLNLNFLVECKYSYPGVKWVFSPHPQESLVIMGCVNTLEDLCTRRLDNKEPLYGLDRDLEYCTRGVKLDSNGADPNTISRGLNQLRYALPNLVAQECRSQITAWNEEDLAISCICPILVTTASLHTLRHGLDLEAFHSATSLNDISEEVDALVVYQEPGPQLHRYCEQLSQMLHEQYPEIKQRLDEFERLEASGEKILPSTWAFDDHFTSVSNNILVVRLDALDRILKLLRSKVVKATESTKRVAALSVDLQEREKHIVPLTQA